MISPNVIAPKLWVIVPVFNEEEALPSMVDEWIRALDSFNPVEVDSSLDWHMLLLDDGSRDGTPRLVDELARKHLNKITAVHHANCGHGQTCIAGYRHALREGADYVFQIDSDGQCDPKYFPELWRAKNAGAVFGRRVRRADGIHRTFISRVLSTVIFLRTRIWIKDSNVPYRIISRTALQLIVDKVPRDFYLANVFVSVLLARYSTITWIPIGFRVRSGGTPSVKLPALVKHASKLWKQLGNMSNAIHSN